MRILSVKPGSAADRAGIRPGDDLVAIGGEPVGDSLDVAYALGWAEAPDGAVGYRFARDGRTFDAVLPAARPDELGIELAPDTYRTCANRCTFCFVDQLPDGLRPSLSVKDEDYRLSFAFGNYVTLTNLTDGDYERIARQRLSPLYVSVHATDDAVRRAMLGNPKAPPVMAALRRLADAGITLHTQIVVCPGTNDGDVLDGTLSDLMSLGESIRSIAIVPVGLTAHREGLPHIEPLDRERAREVLGTVERWQQRFLAERGLRTVYAADELYLVAGRELPPAEEYDDFPQLENGVGLLRNFEADFTARVALLENPVGRPFTATLVTGTHAARFIERTVRGPLCERGIDVRVLPVENRLLGPTVTVAGLLAGRDMADALRDADPSDVTLLPGEAFNDEGLTIDGMTVEDIAEASGRHSVRAADDIIDAFLEGPGASER